MFPMERLDRIVRNETENVKSIVHDYGHLKRTAVGARWFVRILKGTKEEEELAYAAGLLHDIVRPPSEICHAEASGERSKEILSGLGVDRETIERIVEAVKSHREVHEWKSPLHHSIYLADKILEQMGTYVDFRRSYYVGECRDYEGKDPMKSIISHFEHRIKKFNEGSFERFFLPLVKYQYRKVTDFYSLLVKGVPWARELVMEMCWHGKRHDAGFEEAVRMFKPTNREGREIRNEALLYMEGKMFPKFEEILLSGRGRKL
jgi:HD superfamily phosphodiesterase